MKKRSAIKNDLFANEHHREKIGRIVDSLAEIEQHINFSTLAAEVDRTAPRVESAQGGRPPYPTETMVCILVLKRLYNLSDQQMEYQLLDHISYQRSCGLPHPPRNLEPGTFVSLNPERKVATETVRMAA